MKILAATFTLCVLATLGATQGTVPRSGRCRRRVAPEVLDEHELELIEDLPWNDPFERAEDAGTALRYDYQAWKKKNTPSYLWNLEPGHQVEAAGGKVCLMFIPVGDNCKPALGIISEKDAQRLRKLGSQFVPQKDTISPRSFMVECVNRAAWFKWMRLEF